MKRQKVKMSRRERKELDKKVKILNEIEAEKRAAGIDPLDEMVEERSNGDPLTRVLLEAMADDMRAGLDSWGEPMDEHRNWNPLSWFRFSNRQKNQNPLRRAQESNQKG